MSENDDIDLKFYEEIMIFFFSIPTFLVVFIIIWLAVVEPLGFLALVGRILSGFFGMIFLGLFLFGVIAIILSHLDNPDAMKLIMSYAFTLLMFGLLLIMRWAFKKLE